MTDAPSVGRALGESPDATSGPAHDTDDLRVENRRLQAGLQQMQGDVLRLSRALEPMHRLNAELARLRGEAKQLQAEGQSHHERAERLAALLAQLRDEAKQLQCGEEQLRGEVEQLRAAGRACCEHAEQLAGQLRAVYASSSWRLTRPLRWIKQCFSQIIPTSTLRN